MWRCIVRYGTVQYSTVQYSTVRYSTVQYRTVQYSTVQYSTVQYSTIQYSTVQCSTVQCSAVQYSTVQYSTVQYSTVLYSMTSPLFLRCRGLGGSEEISLFSSWPADRLSLCPLAFPNLRENMTSDKYKKESMEGVELGFEIRSMS